MSIKIRIAGKRTPKEMTPGLYVARCVAEEEKHRGRSYFVVLTFIVEKPAPYAGVMLLQWLAISETMDPTSKFIRHWELAAGRQADPDDDLSAAIFVGKVFDVQVGYRQSDKSGRRSMTNAQAAKDDNDFLRVHSIIRKASGSDTNQQPHIVHSHRHRNNHNPIGVVVGVGGTQHQPQSQPQPKPQPQERAGSQLESGGRDTTAGPGHSTKESPRPATLISGAESAAAIAASAEEYALLRTKPHATLRAVGTIKAVFRGAKVVRNCE